MVMVCILYPYPYPKNSIICVFTESNAKRNKKCLSITACQSISTCMSFPCCWSSHNGDLTTGLVGSSVEESSLLQKPKTVKKNTKEDAWSTEKLNSFISFHHRTNSLHYSSQESHLNFAEWVALYIMLPLFLSALGVHSKKRCIAFSSKVYRKKLYTVLFLLWVVELGIIFFCLVFFCCLIASNSKHHWHTETQSELK